MTHRRNSDNNEQKTVTRMSRTAWLFIALALSAYDSAAAQDALSADYGQASDSPSRNQLRRSPLRGAEPMPPADLGQSAGQVPLRAPQSGARRAGTRTMTTHDHNVAPAANSAYGSRGTAALEPANLPLVPGEDVVRNQVARADGATLGAADQQAVHQADHQAAVAISPRSTERAEDGAEGEAGASASPIGSWASFSSVMASLGLVLALFFVVAWLMRRGMPGAIPTLPKGVVEVLGRAPMPGRQQMQLLRVGHKLILVHMSLTGVETLTEINDPAEVDRLAGLCQQGSATSATRVFHEVLDHFGREQRGSADFLDQDHGLELVSSGRRGRGRRA